MKIAERLRHTPGAMRAAKLVVDGCLDQATPFDYDVNAAIISRETHDAELVEALEAALALLYTLYEESHDLEQRDEAVAMAEAALRAAKGE